MARPRPRHGRRPMLGRGTKPRGDYIYGVNAVRETLAAGRRTVTELLVARQRGSATTSALQELAAGRGAHTVIVEPSQLDQLAGTAEHQGVVARVGPFHYAVLEAVVEAAQRDQAGAFLLILDQVQDPHNLGAIVRTALGCGAHGVIIPRDKAVAVTGTVVKSSAGATEWIPIVQVTNIVSTMNYLKSKDIWVVGFEAPCDQDIYQYSFRGGQALVLGAEGSGLRRLVREKCDTLLQIPIVGNIGSYNVSVAAALAMGEVARQRLERKAPESP